MTSPTTVNSGISPLLPGGGQVSSPDSPTSSRNINILPPIESSDDQVTFLIKKISNLSLTLYT